MVKKSIVLVGLLFLLGVACRSAEPPAGDATSAMTVEVFRSPT